MDKCQRPMHAFHPAAGASALDDPSG